jgi:LPS-assembly protein
MVLEAGYRRGMGMERVGRTIAYAAIATALWCAGAPAVAQTLNETIAGRASGQGNARLLVEAKEIIYDNDRNTVSASGNVELNYQGRTLQADRVIYDRNTGRVYAEGNARLTDASGAVVTGSRFELTDDFRSGFIDSLQVEQTVVQRGVTSRGRFSAPRAERTEGDTTVFQRGTYTACEPCKDNPERPPLWQVKAARIIHNNSERTIYYENATLELLGMPIAYVPYFWTPDPTVTRKTGFLAPHYITSSTLGQGVSVPFFWNMAPNYDLTIQPTYFSEQGLLGQVEWRHRLLTGSYNIRAAGIFQQDPEAFLPAPLGPRDREERGSLETTGRFHINERWRWGWDVTMVSDKWFLHNYRIRSDNIADNYGAFREAISTVYLQGQGDRSWFDARGYYFKTLSTYDWQDQQPLVHPVIDYNKRVDGPRPIGGEVALDVNLTSLTREAAQFQATNNLLRADLFPGSPYAGLFETCTVYERGKCLVRGLSGTYSRLSAQASWRRNFIDPIGQVWTPFTYVRADGFFNAPDTSGYPNSYIPNFINREEEFAGRAMPAAGLEYRYPFIGQLGGWGTQQLAPIAQIIARPNETRIGRLPNEDAQSFVFDDSNLFNWDKFSGYDRVEGGVRASTALKYSLSGANDFYGEALFGQSYHLAGRNSFAAYDLVNAGRDSGLESTLSDYVGRLQVSPNKATSFMTRARFDQEDFSVQRFEAGFSGAFTPFPLTTTVMYARYEAQPELGYDRRREGVLGSASYGLTSRWSLSGSVLVDLDKYLDAKSQFARDFNNYLLNPQGAAPIYKPEQVWQVTGTSVGVSYIDECTTLSITYAMTPRQLANGTTESDKTLLVKLDLRTLGETNFKQSFGPQTQDGVVTR